MAFRAAREQTLQAAVWSSRISWSWSARPFNATATRVALNHLIESRKLACPETGIARGAAAHDVCSVAALDGVADIDDGNYAGKWEEAFSHLTQFLEQEGIAECLNATRLTMVIG